MWSQLYRRRAPLSSFSRTPVELLPSFSMPQGCLAALDSIAWAGYKEKLQLIGISKEEDPYLLWESDRFVDEMTLWPPIECGHIFCYFMTRCFYEAAAVAEEEFGSLQLLSEGHVRDIKLCRLAASWTCIIMALVNSSQSIPENAHHALVGAKSDGTIITAHCTCMAG